MTNDDYEPGVYETENHELYAWSGSNWRVIYGDFSGMEKPIHHYAPFFGTNLRKINGSHQESGKLAEIRAWWKETSKQEDVGWSDMITLASILMED